MVFAFLLHCSDCGFVFCGFAAVTVDLFNQLYICHALRFSSNCLAVITPLAAQLLYRARGILAENDLQCCILLE